MIDSGLIQIIRTEYESLMDGDIIKNDVNHFMNIIQSMNTRNLEGLEVPFNLYNYKLLIRYNLLESGDYIIHVEFPNEYAIFKLINGELYITTDTIPDWKIDDSADSYIYQMILRIVSLYCLTLKKEVNISEFANIIKEELNFYKSQGFGDRIYVKDIIAYLISQNKIILRFESHSDVNVIFNPSKDNFQLTISSNTISNNIIIPLVKDKYFSSDYVLSEHLEIYDTLLKCIYVRSYSVKHLDPNYEKYKNIVNKILKSIPASNDIDILQTFDTLLETNKKMSTTIIEDLRIMYSQGKNNIVITVKDGYNTVLIGLSLIYKSKYSKVLMYTINIDNYTLASDFLDIYTRDFYSYSIAHLMKLLVEDDKNE